MSSLSSSDSNPGDADQVSDRSLLRRIRSGSDDAATQLYLRYARRLRAMANANLSKDLTPRVDSEDIVQSVFRTFFRRVAGGEYEIPNGEELWGLLLVIGLNKVRALGSYHRASKRDVLKTIRGESLEGVGKQVEEDETELSILKIAINEVLEELSPVHREILSDRIEGREVAEIASRVGRSKRSVERILQGLLQSLSKLISEER